MCARKHVHAIFCGYQCAIAAVLSNVSTQDAFYLQHAPTSDAPCKQRYAKAAAAPETAKSAAGTRKSTQTPQR